MISLKSFMDSGSEDLLKSTRESYRDSLTAMGESATQVCPHISEPLQKSLVNLRDRLKSEVDPAEVKETGKQVGQELEKWSKEASQYFHQTAQEIKEIMLIVAQTAKAVGERDQRYAREFSEFAANLEAIGNLNDLAKVRHSLGKSALQFKTTVRKMVEDGQASIAQLRSELSVYQSRLKEVEHMASQDPVTGLANRRKVERQIEFRIEQGKVFSIALFDLNDFKQVNDRYGHVAGDQVLTQFAEELKSFFRATDIVSRWGGDEFLVVLEGDPKGVRSRIDCVREWVDGDYTIKIDGKLKNLKITASVGMATWQSPETAAELFVRADTAMYQQKTTQKAQPK